MSEMFTILGVGKLKGLKIQYFKLLPKLFGFKSNFCDLFGNKYDFFLKINTKIFVFWTIQKKKIDYRKLNYSYNSFKFSSKIIKIKEKTEISKKLYYCKRLEEVDCHSPRDYHWFHNFSKWEWSRSEQIQSEACSL